jgi:hypothetical protein
MEIVSAISMQLEAELKGSIRLGTAVTVNSTGLHFINREYQLLSWNGLSWMCQLNYVLHKQVIVAFIIIIIIYMS